MIFFFFNDTATTEIYTLSLHDALPISAQFAWGASFGQRIYHNQPLRITKIAIDSLTERDRKSTRLNSSHQIISYAVFCLKKKKNKNELTTFLMANQHEVDERVFMYLSE